MIAIGLFALISATAEAPAMTGDFDGDGKSDTAVIVRQPDGRRDVVATFHDGRREIVYARVDEQAVLGVIPPVEIDRVCEPFAKAVPDCSRQLAEHDRDGLSFKPDMHGVPALALWNGTHFSLQFSNWKPQAAPARLIGDTVPSSVSSPPPVALPCKLKDRRGRLVEVNPRICQAVTKYFEHPIESNERSTHTGLQLEVGTTGKVEDCRVIESSGAPELDAKACSIAIEKVRYTPGSADGPVKRQTRRIRITWPKMGELPAVSEG